MGLFNGYLKDGPGVSKNEKKKKGFFLYTDILFRKFFKLIKANCLYILFSIPFLAVIFLVIAPYLMSILGFTSEVLTSMGKQAVDAAVQAGEDIKDIAKETQRMAGIYYLLLTVSITVFIFNFFGSGPVSAAYAYAMRCYTRGEHTWLVSDGKDKAKENFKHSILLYIINMVVLTALVTAYYFYGNAEFTGAVSYVIPFARSFILVALLILVLINMFAYQIMVTYECSFRDLVKNSTMIALAKLPMCIVLIAISVSVIFLICYNIADPILAVVIYMVIGLMVTRFPIEFYAARVLEKNMRVLKKREEKNAAKITYLDEE